MRSLPARSLGYEAERHFVESLRARYEEAGFAFQIEPVADQLPDFMGSYRPDAVARKPGRNVAIDVRRSGPSEPPLPAIRRLFEGHPDWHLHVAVMADDSLGAAAILRAEPADIGRQVAEIRTLHATGHRRAAFILAWALLEAALRTRRNDVDRASPPGTLVQALAMNGLIEPDAEHALRSLVGLRDRIVHGDLVAEPTAEDIALLLAAVENVLSEELSPS